MSWVENILKLIELKARYFFALWILGALLIFLPLAIKEQMGLANLPLVIKPWIGIITLVSFVMWVIQLFQILRNWFKLRRMRSDIIDQLHTLTSDERDIFIVCLAKNQRTIHRNITDPDTHSLVSKRLLIQAAGAGNMLAWPFTIPTFVWVHLKENDVILFPELLDEDATEKVLRRQNNGIWGR